MSKLVVWFDLNPPHPRAGSAYLMVRLAPGDKQDIDAVADRLGMTTSALTRILLVRGARHIMQQLEMQDDD